MDSIKQPMVELTEMFRQRMAAFDTELQKVSNPPSNLAKDFAEFKVFVMQALKSLQQQIELIARSQDQLDMYSRRKILLFHGISEEKNEDPTKVIVNIVKKHFKLPEFSADDIRRCHRLGRHTDPKRRRPLLVKLKEVSVRDNLWYQKTTLKGSDITMSEFLTKMRHDIFMAARKSFGVTKCWTREGQILVLGHDDVRHKIFTLEDITKIMQSETDSKTTAPVKDTTVTTKSKRTISSKK